MTADVCMVGSLYVTAPYATAAGPRRAPCSGGQGRGSPATRGTLVPLAALRGQTEAPARRLHGPMVVSRWAQFGPHLWMLLRCSLLSAQLNTNLIQSAAEMSMAQLIQLAAMRWSVETCL